MKAIPVLLSILCILAPWELFASQTSVRAHQFMAKSYARETSFQFERDTKYPIFSMTGEGYYVHIRDGHDLVVFLEKDASIPARLEGAELHFWEPYRFESDRAYLVFPPQNWYRVVDEDDSKYQIEYTLGGTKLRCSVEKAEFVRAEHVRDADGRLIDRGVVKPEDAICVLEFSNGVRGTGFLFYEGDTLYCYTNQHVAMNTGRLKVSLMDGSILQTGDVELAEDVDLARIRVLSERPGFETIGTPVLRESALVLGNSLGSGRVTSLSGKVSGLNATEIETTVKFVSGNSGSPILNKANEVVGVAAWIEYFPDSENITSATTFEGGRRVGLRLDREIEWIPVDMGRYVSGNRLILQTMTFIDELPQAMMMFVSEQPSIEVVMSSFTDPVLKQWMRGRVTRFEGIRQRHKSKVEAGLSHQGRRFLYTPAYASIEKAYTDEVLKESEKFWTSLQQKIVAKRRSMERAVPYPDTSYMRREIERTVDILEFAQSVVAEIQRSHRDYFQGL